MRQCGTKSRGAVAYLKLGRWCFAGQNRPPGGNRHRLAQPLATPWPAVGSTCDDPSIEYARHGGYTIISDACIACDAVRSVKLYVAFLSSTAHAGTGAGVRTSAALVRILLKERFGVSPKTQPCRSGLPSTTRPPMRCY